MIRHVDVAIVGAGPAGAACALSFSQATGLKVALIDKARFPRPKVCGDAVGGHSIKMLARSCPPLLDDLRAFPLKTRTRSTRIHVNDRAPFEINWVNEAYCCPRYEFDALLLDGVRRYVPSVNIVEGFSVSGITREPDGLTITDKVSQAMIRARLVIGADGAHSVVAKNLTDTRVDHHHHIAAVRTYFEGVSNVRPETTEVYLSRSFTPGYFWVFPVTDDRVNVGFGMLSETVAAKGINLRRSLFDFIRQSPLLQARFQMAREVGKVEGFGLPIASRRVPMSGDRFLLAGDAASLIDPASGDGIGNAILSGIIAAETAISALENNSLGPASLGSYDARVWSVLGKELQRSTLAMRTYSRMPWLADVGARMAGTSLGSQLLRRIM
jgi:geranylgeranyl reductase family protein